VDGEDRADEEAGVRTLNRRTALKRGAIATGAALYVVPAVQVIGLGKAHAATPSVPPTTPPTDPPAGGDISNIQIIVQKNGTLYGLKWDPDDSPDGWDAWSSAAPDSNDCIKFYEDDTGQTVQPASGGTVDAFNDNVEVQIISDTEWHIILPLPSGVTYVTGFVKSGNVTNDPCPPSGQPGNGVIAFTS
jgi:hypothetical protein